jgi:hypothetical protein
MASKVMVIISTAEKGKALYLIIASSVEIRINE